MILSILHIIVHVVAPVAAAVMIAYAGGQLVLDDHSMSTGGKLGILSLLILWLSGISLAIHSITCP